MKKPVRIGVGGPVGSGKTALIEKLCRALSAGVLPGRRHERYLHKGGCGVPYTGRRPAGGADQGCRDREGVPHTAIREDASLNQEAIGALIEEFPDLDILFVESGGDNLAASFSPELVDCWVYVIDVSGGDKIPRKGGPGVTRSSLLVINKVDLAPMVGADLAVMEKDADRMRKGRPSVFTNLKSGYGPRGCPPVDKGGCPFP